MKKSISQQLIDFFKRNPNKIASVEIEKMTWHNKNGTTANPRSLIRRLQELANDGIIEPTYVGNTTYYQLKSEHRPVKQLVEIKDGKAYVSYVQEEVISGLEKW